MRVLGIDPGLGRTGIALVDGAPGRLHLVTATRLDTVPQTSEAVRLANLFELVVGAISDMRPDVAALEQLFLSSNRRTAMRVSEARGVILCALGRSRVPIAEYTPTQVKEAVCGYGGARKQQVTRMTQQLLGAPAVQETRDDVADACAVAICHHHRAALRTHLVGRPVKMSSRLEMAVARARARLGSGGR
ncbi:MAG: crossover junction endodeoxyribonuclease RuvC [Candidatus Dormibacteraeota bacterium]|nr:crossover junction endodeoxyribonuclease RuvC [Candidatus Dormibacteraeota bacterium]MBV9525247.1 crossover junction endodeoxyribonuclease RuvC [Candidatus Dormibacteraeota bacterium]